MFYAATYSLGSQFVVLIHIRGIPLLLSGGPESSPNIKMFRLYSCSCRSPIYTVTVLIVSLLFICLSAIVSTLRNSTHAMRTFKEYSTVPSLYESIYWLQLTCNNLELKLDTFHSRVRKVRLGLSYNIWVILRNTRIYYWLPFDSECMLRFFLGVQVSVAMFPDVRQVAKKSWRIKEKQDVYYDVSHAQFPRETSH